LPVCDNVRLPVHTDRSVSETQTQINGRLLRCIHAVHIYCDVTLKLYGVKPTNYILVDISSGDYEWCGVLGCNGMQLG
jgi:hypothetical protein